jgi:predicted permease
MTADVTYKLLAILLIVSGSWCVGRARWLGPAPPPGLPAPIVDPARVLANSAFYIFIPALLCRTTARLDMATLPWHTLIAYFVPVQVILFVLYAWHTWRQRRHPGPPAVPTVRTITSMFGNTAQVGIPVVTAVFGEPGLGIHVTVMGLHGLILLSTLTVLVELDRARAHARSADARPVGAMALTTLRNTIIHPVVLPVSIGWLWNLSGIPIPPVIDDVLALLSTAVVPVSLVVIGISLAYYGLAPRLGPSIGNVVVKLVVQPALVLASARWLFGLHGLPLSVVVLMGALPVGANALIFAQRYETLEAETATAIVISTLLYCVTLPMWLFVLSALPA